VKICIILVAFFQDTGCIRVPMQWTPLKHTGFLSTSYWHWKCGKAKNTCNWLDQKHDVIRTHTVCLLEDVNVITKYKFTFAMFFNMSA